MITERNLIVEGKTERQLNEEIVELASDLFPFSGSGAG